MSRRKDSDLPIPTKTLSVDDLRKVVYESGIAVSIIERAVGIPHTTLDKCLKALPVKGKYPRSLPGKYELPLLKYIKEQKALKEDANIEVKEILEESGVDVPKPEIPNTKYVQDKVSWIEKLVATKNELNTE